MADNPILEISKIQLPSGHTYEIKDARARASIAALSGATSFLGITSSTVTDGSTEAQITIGGETVNASNGNIVIAGSKEFIFDGTQWCEFGDLDALQITTSSDNVLGQDTTFTNSSSSVTFSGGTTHKVLGKDTTFTLTSGSVSHGTPTKDAVLGEDTTFTASAPTINLVGTTKYLSASASGANTAWNNKNQQSVVTGYSSPTSDTFVKSVSAVTNHKLVTQSITPTDGTESVSKVTKSASKLVTTTIPNVSSTSNVTIPNVTSVGSASTWSFTMGSGNDSETLIINGANSTAPTLGTDLSATKVTMGTAITAATGSVAANGTGSDIVTAVTISDKTVAKQGTAITVATGETSTTGTGSAIVTGVTIGDSASAITSLGDPTTTNVIGASSTFTITQPTISLTANDNNNTGYITYLQEAAPTATAPTITVGTNDKVNAVTAMPSSTVGTAITVGTTDQPTVVKTIGTGTAAAQTITVGTNDVVGALTSASLTENSNS